MWQELIAEAPPSSKADCEPTMAKSLLHASWVAVRSELESVFESARCSTSLRPYKPFGQVAL